jgi:hypothetical protein
MCRDTGGADAKIAAVVMSSAAVRALSALPPNFCGNGNEIASGRPGASRRPRRRPPPTVRLARHSPAPIPVPRNPPLECSCQLGGSMVSVLSSPLEYGDPPKHLRPARTS